jgi:hypothetical protein
MMQLSINGIRHSNIPVWYIRLNEQEAQICPNWGVALTLPRAEVYFCHQDLDANNIGNFTTGTYSIGTHNIGTHLKSIETSFQVGPLFF